MLTICPDLADETRQTTAEPTPSAETVVASTPRRPRRALAAILFADMVGYTALMHADEARAYQARSRFRQALLRAVRGQGGTVVQHYGDGAVAVFRSAIAGTRAAVQLQREVRRGRRVEVRVGVHLADIVRDSEGIYGHGVNVAARVEALCAPGGVLVSEAVAVELRNQDGLELRSLGTVTLKHIPEPVGLFTVCHPALRECTRRDVAGAAHPAGTATRSRAGPRGGFPARLLGLVRELRRRRVDRFAVSYVAASMALLEAIRFLVDAQAVPEVLLARAPALFVAALPVSLLFSWVFDVSVRVTGPEA